MLETLRGKRMMFVGDSLNRGQYVSLICLLHHLIPQHAKSMETFDSLTVFTAKVASYLLLLDYVQYILNSFRCIILDLKSILVHLFSLIHDFLVPPYLIPPL